MKDLDYAQLTAYAKALANFKSEQERLVMGLGEWIKPHLAEITEDFYEMLMAVPETKGFIDGRVDHLKNAHMKWLEKLFTGPYDEEYTAYMYRVGDIHVKVNLPVEFMAAGMTLISESLRTKLTTLYDGDCCQCRDAMAAINGLLGYSLIAMQKSYQRSMEQQLEKFLKITGISRTLYNNMALAYKG